MSGMKYTFPEHPGWVFELDELSIGFYVARGTGVLGQSVELKGYEPEKLLDECRRTAAIYDRMIRQKLEKSKQ
jgi:hypothetical protein